MPGTRPADEVITEEVASWPGVEVGPGRFDSVRFTVGRRELGHLHGDRLADLPFPRAIRDQLVAAGEVVPHRPASGLGLGVAPDPLRAGRPRVIRLLRMQYDRALASRSGRAAAG